MRRGYFKHWRKMVDWPWRSQPNFYSVWGYLLEMGAGVERYELFEGKRILLQPGQLVIGRKVIAKKTGVHQSSVQRILSRLEIEHQIEQQTGAKSRLITIMNWDEYHSGEQQIEPQANHKRTTSEPQVNTGLEVKKVKNVKEYTNTFSQFWDVYPRKQNKWGAFKVWEKMNELIPPIDELVKIVEKQNTWPQFQNYTPHATTWLNGHRWEDEEHKEYNKNAWLEEDE